MQTGNAKKRKVAIVGGGPAALALAAHLDKSKYEIAIYEKNTALARKFLVAGKGGFNLTHSEAMDKMAERYIPRKFLHKALDFFTNEDFRTWLKQIGIDTYVGSSRRVFPVKGIKPVEVLKAIEKQLLQNNVEVHYGYEWKGFDQAHALQFRVKEEWRSVRADLVVFALGGASWRITGSDGTWLDHFRKQGITNKAFRASNCAYEVKWNKELLKHIEGKALKNAIFSCGDKTHTGEAVLTAFGIEGSGVYPLSAEVRKQLTEQGTATLFIDLKPGIERVEVESRLASAKKIKEVLQDKLKVSEAVLHLLKHATTKEQYTDAAYLARLIKHFPVHISGLAPIDEAISTVGGIDLEEVNENFEFNKLSGHYCIGEMLDWDAPTGGYLLQACFSMGVYLGKVLNEKSGIENY